MASEIVIFTTIAKELFLQAVKNSFMNDIMQ